MMRVVFLLLISIIAYRADAQLPWKYPGKGIQMGTMIADSVARLPSDTSINKTGVAVKNGVMYLGNGSRWSSIGGSTSGIDSVTFNSSAWVDTVKYWKSGSATVVGYIDRFDGRISGGFVTRVSGRTFQVTACVYSINGLRYLSLQTNVTLSAVEDSARFDVVVGNSGGSVSVVKGTASRYPTPPALSSTQVAFAFIYVSQDTISVSPPPTQYWGVVNGALTNTVALAVSLGGKVVTSTNPAVGGTLFKTWSITDGGSLDINSGYATADLLYLQNTGGGRRYGFRLTSTGDIILRDYTGSVDRWKIDANGNFTVYQADEAIFATKSNGKNLVFLGDVNATHNGTTVGIDDDNQQVTIVGNNGVSLIAQAGSANGIVWKTTSTVSREVTWPDKDGTVAMLSDVGGTGGLDTAGVRSIVSDSVKTMVSGEGIVFDELRPDSIKVSVDTAWLSAKLDSVKNMVGVGYTDISFFFNQSGTSNPVLTSLHNNAGATLTATRVDVGQYTITASSPIFDVAKSVPSNGGDQKYKNNIIGPDGTNYGFYLFFQVDDSTYSVLCFDPSGTPLDGLLDNSNTFLQIKIYQ